jgi:ABC-2 type transport system permease protein
MSSVSNIAIIAHREYTVRVRTRSFLLGTLAIVVGVIAIAFIPVVFGYLDRAESQRIGVWADAQVGGDPPAMLSSLLAPPVEGREPAPAAFILEAAPDLAAARASVEEGRFAAVLAIRRSGNGDLTFTLYTDQPVTGRTPVLLRQASSSYAIADRLERLGIAPGDQAVLFAPVDYLVASAGPGDDSPAPGSPEQGASYLLGFGMTILIFMLIILYGTWVAMSVAEEKSSRVMEVILNAATPFQLLSGKVLGVGAVAVTQYLAIIIVGIVALVAQAPLVSAVLGDAAEGLALPAGLTVQLLLVLGLYGVLGFLLYSVLFAAAGSLVSRQEDVNQAVMPMTLVSTVGYLVGVYAATGMLDMQAGWLRVLAQVPFLSPFIMLSRVAAGQAEPWEVPLSVVLLLLAIVLALWVAARIYAAGVLLYGQRPGLRAILRMARTGM